MSSTKKVGLAVIIPMFNEERGAKRCVDAITEVLDKTPGKLRLFVVNDGSADNTLKVLRDLKRDDFDIVTYDKNRGYGAALLTGARAALAKGYDFGLFMDSDLTNDPALIPTFYAAVVANEVDLVKATRYAAGGGMRGVPWQRQMVTIVGNFIARNLFRMGLTDCTNGFRAVRLSLIADLELHERGFPSIVEELFELKKKGVRTGEIPIVLTARVGADNQSRFQYRPRVFWTYLKYSLLAAAVPSGSFDRRGG